MKLFWPQRHRDTEEENDERKREVRRRESEWVDFRPSTFHFLYFLFILTSDSFSPCLCG